MGTQKAVIIGQSPEEIIGGPIAEHHGKKKEKEKKKKVEEEIKKKKFDKDKSEVLEEQIEEEKKASAPAKQEAKSRPESVGEKQGKAKVRSKKYQEVNALIDHEKKYNLVEALELVKKTSFSKFDGNVEVHIRVISKSRKPENIRGLLKYPNPTGKSIKAVILDEKVASEIEKTGKAEADMYIATPAMMPKIAKLAKILGPKGKMPNPKSGTIAADPEKVKKELEAGQIEYKTDSFGNIHQVIGKVSAELKKLEENFNVLLYVLPKEKITSLTICATMGPGIKVQI